MSIRWHLLLLYYILFLRTYSALGSFTPSFPFNFSTSYANGSLSRTIFVCPNPQPSLLLIPLLTNGVPSYENQFLFDITRVSFLNSSGSVLLDIYNGTQSWVPTVSQSNSSLTINFSRPLSNSLSILSFSIFFQPQSLYISNLNLSVPVVPNQIKLSFYHYFLQPINTTGTFLVNVRIITNATDGIQGFGSSSLSNYNKFQWIETKKVNVTFTTLRYGATQDPTTGGIIAQRVFVPDPSVVLQPGPLVTIGGGDFAIQVPNATNWVEYDPSLSVLFINEDEYLAGDGGDGGAGDGGTGGRGGDGDGTKLKIGLAIGLVGGIALCVFVVIPLLAIIGYAFVRYRHRDRKAAARV